MSSPTPPNSQTTPGSDRTDTAPDLTNGPSLVKTDEEWRAQLTDEEYQVARRKGTERAFTGRYWDHHEDGVYACVCCDSPLFDSAAKYESGSGWPSFYEPADPAQIATEEDGSLFMRRTEILCKTCGAHLGHVFPDGPRPTGLRYCTNSASLKFQPRRGG
jgi:peptide-methionine (R)-S-oxide reductase